MIDSKELRPGNYIQDKEGKLITVEEILKDGINREFDYDHGYVVLHDIKDCFAIPITEEWLIKLGFTPNPKFGEGTYGNDKVGVFLDKERGELGLENRVIKELHIFQNWYFFRFGEELTIIELA